METAPIPAEPLDYYRGNSSGWDQVVKLLAIYALVRGASSFVPALGFMMISWPRYFFTLPPLSLGLARFVNMMLGWGEFALDAGLITSGIGCLLFQPWARRLFLICAVTTFSFTVVRSLSNWWYPRNAGSSIAIAVIASASSIANSAALNALFYILMKHKNADSLFGETRTQEP
jgi:hypothetical protein